MDEIKLMAVLARRLERTEAEVAELPPGTRERITAYLRARFGWFAREGKTEA